MSKCVCATDNSIYVPSENYQCENFAPFFLPGELSKYLIGARVCKAHLKYLIAHGQEWVESFKSAGIKQGQDIQSLQNLYRKQSIWAELS